MKKKDTKVKKIEELKGQLARALADYQNLQKRVEVERKDWIHSSNKELLLHILPVLDTLILANKHLNDAGLEACIKQFTDVLKSEGVERIETEGREFDPHTMECMETIEGEENKVLEEVRAGFTLAEQVLRPAQVRVGKKITEEQYV